MRLGKARQSLEAARSLLGEKLWDDAVNRAAAAALQAARALAAWRGEVTGTRYKMPAWDPDYRPGMQRPTYEKRIGADPVLQVIEAFQQVAPAVNLPPDAPDYLRALVEDGADADRADAQAFDEEEAVRSVDNAEKLVAQAAKVISFADAEAAPGGNGATA
jgi:uncharacterized protein (UPF0332 family)